MGTATTYSTARSPLRRGASCVLSDSLHNLSRKPGLAATACLMRAGADRWLSPQVAPLTPRCAAGPYRWSMGSPAHTATQGVNLRIQGPKHPPIGPITPPIHQALPPSTRAGTRPTPPTIARHALAADTRTQRPRRRHAFMGEADAGNGADDGTTPRDLAALTPRCAAGPYRWSMGSPAHTATQGVNVRIQGPKHPPIR